MNGSSHLWLPGRGDGDGMDGLETRDGMTMLLLLASPVLGNRKNRQRHII